MSRKKQNKTESFNKVFPSRLRQLISETNTIQQDIANVLGVSRQSISGYCDGSSAPSWEAIVKLANYFKVSTDWLLGNSNVKTLNIELQAVCDYTGLSDDAIARLHVDSETRKHCAAEQSLILDENILAEFVSKMICYDDLLKLVAAIRSYRGLQDTDSTLHIDLENATTTLNTYDIYKYISTKIFEEFMETYTSVYPIFIK